MPETRRLCAVELLNTLIETTLDSVAGYEKAAELARNPRFQSLFKDKALARQKMADELKAEVRGLGAEPWDKSSFRGRAQRAFLALRDKIGGKSDKPVIEAVEHDEDFIRDQFAEAANDEKAPAIRPRPSQSPCTAQLARRSLMRSAPSSIRIRMSSPLREPVRPRRVQPEQM